MEQLVHRFDYQVEAHGAHNHGYAEACQVLKTPVPIGVARIGRARRQAKAQQAHDIARSIGQVIDSIRNKRHSAREQSDNTLAHAQHDIAANANDTCGQSGTRTRRSVQRLALRLRHQATYQPVNHHACTSI